MRIAIVGPAHPYKGGIVQQTTELAHRLSAAGHSVQLLSWKTQYPFFYPGQQFVAIDKPERPIFKSTKRSLSWKNPVGWWHHIRQLRSYDQIIFIWWVPTIQGPVYLTMLKALGKQGPHTTLICHNVLPHEPRPGDRVITKAIMNRVNLVIVHTKQQAELAKSLGAKHVQSATLPVALPSSAPIHKLPAGPLHNQLLFFGLVRKYKGLDVLLKALSQVPTIKLIVAGEFWETELYDNLRSELKLVDRVDFRKGYVASEDIADLFAETDALVLPYRGGTGSYQAAIAHSYSVPVLGTTASSIAEQVTDAVDGLLCKPDDVNDLVRIIKEFYKPGIAAKLQAGITPMAADGNWGAYLRALS